MNPNHTSFKFPQIKPHPWNKVFRNKAPANAVDLVAQFLKYDPKARVDPFDVSPPFFRAFFAFLGGASGIPDGTRRAQALAHPFFDELREANARLPNGKSLPNLFNFTDGGNSQFASLPDFAFASSFAEYRMMAERNLTKKLLPPEILKKAIADKKVPAPK